MATIDLSPADRLAAIGTGMIDVHTHAIDPDLPDVGLTHPGSYPSVRRVSDDHLQILMDGRVYRDVDSRCWSAQARIRDMDAENVSVQVLSPIPITLCHSEPAAGAEVLARAQNDFLATTVDTAPDRLLALGCVPLQDPDRATAELRRCVLELGFVGVEIGTRVGDDELADPKFLPFFQEAAALGAVVFLHPVDRTLDPRLAKLRIGFGMGMPTETATAAAGLLVTDIFDRAPGLRLLLAHGGGTLPAALPRVSFGQQIIAGVTDPAALASSRAGQLWCDSLTYDIDGLLLAARRFGSDHVVLGTDYPFDAREVPAGAVLSPAGRDDGLNLLDGVARANALALLAAAGRSHTDIAR